MHISYIARPVLACRQVGEVEDFAGSKGVLTACLCSSRCRPRPCITAELRARYATVYNYYRYRVTDSTSYYCVMGL